jgi:hypothetical protein
VWGSNVPNLRHIIEDEEAPMRSVILAAIMSLGLVTAAAAQSPPPSTTTPSPTDKAAISKACSDQANAKGLHGKPRKQFRAACKRRGGKPE